MLLQTDTFEVVKNIVGSFMENHEDFLFTPEQFNLVMNNRQIEKDEDLSPIEAMTVRSLKSLRNVSTYSDYGLRCMTQRLGALKAEHLQLLVEDGYEDLVSQLINARLESFFHRKGRQAKKLLIRDFYGKHCAVLTDRYAVFDDDEVCQILADNEYLMNAESIWYDCTPERFHVRFISGNKLFVPGDTSPLSMAVFVDNSMVGQGCFKIRFGIYRWACTNGMIAGLKEFEIVKECHKGLKDYQKIVATALKDIHTYEDTIIAMVQQATQTPSSVVGLDKDKASAYLSKKLTVSEKKAEQILELFAEYGGRSKWDLVNAITDVAHDSELPERLNLEAKALAVA